MDVVIFGTGAIGSILATFLQESGKGHHVHLVGRQDRMRPIKEQGLIYKPYSVTDEARWIKTSGYHMYSSIQDVPRADVVFITMKAHGLPRGLEDAETLFQREQPAVVITMNGLGLKDIVSRVVPARNIIETIAFYPSRLEGNVVLNTGGNSFLVVEDTRAARDVFDSMYLGSSIDYRFDKDFQTTQWTKAIINVAINAIAALTMLPVGKILDTETLSTIVKENIKEAVLVAKKLGITFKENLIDVFWNFALRDPVHSPSMQQDMARHRLTEIDFLNGYIAKLADELGIDAPVNKALTSLVHLLEARLVTK